MCVAVLTLDGVAVLRLSSGHPLRPAPWLTFAVSEPLVCGPQSASPGTVPRRAACAPGLPALIR
jgi:hypothetical protein